ncbi:peptidoglycan-associated lipoprotein Pal [Hwanghaeella grinnelliae]|uniref:Peptidoglycan-associated lipoprotein n=1 Tax=Hwanghaeella grinnelliae TaxID=2500179 RepID=A0A437QGU2_9PROT|nr:peptidoglycan-associated lipoprotein Pal [Hwanghaeella grinnelliae]RVU33783.1 peptidoglycan-associated lipoprotein Pal [Hwanghaeella grinnelliae]
MRFKVLSLLAALLLVAACETAPEESADSGSSGTQTTSSTSSTQAPAASATNQIAPGSVQDFLVNVGDRIFFDFDASDIRGDQVAVLEKQAAWLKQFPGVTVVIEGHCDERGTREYNLALGERRANSHKDYLISLGVDPNRLETISYGKERPAVLGSNDAAWAQNRRGVVVLKNAAAS